MKDIKSEILKKKKKTSNRNVLLVSPIMARFITWSSIFLASYRIQLFFDLFKWPLFGHVAQSLESRKLYV